MSGGEGLFQVVCPCSLMFGYLPIQVFRHSWDISSTKVFKTSSSSLHFRPSSSWLQWRRKAKQERRGWRWQRPCCPPWQTGSNKGRHGETGNAAYHRLCSFHWSSKDIHATDVVKKNNQWIMSTGSYLEMRIHIANSWGWSSLVLLYYSSNSVSKTTEIGRKKVWINVWHTHAQTHVSCDHEIRDQRDISHDLMITRSVHKLQTASCEIHESSPADMFSFQRSYVDSTNMRQCRVCLWPGSYH